MVSEFLSEVEGPLKGVDNSGNEVRAREIINPGKNFDGYWTGEQVAKQFKKAIAIHKKNHPSRIGVWAFDNSCNHNCYAKDALLVGRMNMTPGGKQHSLRNTRVNDVDYKMVFPDDYEIEHLRGQPKGIRQVLQDRGLWREGLKRLCPLCKSGNKDDERNSCCAERILGLQPDFKAQKSLLEEIATEEGQIIIFYPKFHCELNFIEMYWGACKRYARIHCDYTFRGLENIIHDALDSVPLETIRKYAWMAFRYMDAYRKGLKGSAAEMAVKKYKSHRRISENQMIANVN